MFNNSPPIPLNQLGRNNPSLKTLPQIPLLSELMGNVRHECLGDRIKCTSKDDCALVEAILEQCFGGSRVKLPHTPQNAASKLKVLPNELPCEIEQVTPVFQSQLLLNSEFVKQLTYVNFTSSKRKTDAQDSRN